MKAEERKERQIGNRVMEQLGKGRDRSKSPIQEPNPFEAYEEGSTVSSKSISSLKSLSSTELEKPFQLI
jgi:hypothetical protein